ncbi:MAG: aldose 1-epimerase family protein [Eubacteriales bacterium]
MKYLIKNEHLSVVVFAKGGELQSIKGNDGTEYLWQGDPTYWDGKAPNLFPYIARLTQGRYKIANQEYSMDIHGFLKDTTLELEEHTENKLVLTMESNEVTEKQYPFKFQFYVMYEIIGQSLQITYSVENQDTKTMYFGIGGHPGFHVPLEKELGFEDYYLQFAESGIATRVGMSEDCFVTEQDTEFELVNGNKIPLVHTMFDDDAIILTDMSKEITLKSDKSNKNITVRYPEMKYLGLWHMPKTDAPYICIEPWTSLPSRKDVVEDLETQPNLIALETEKKYTNMWSITIS